MEETKAQDVKELEVTTLEVQTSEIPMDAEAMKFIFGLGKQSRDFKVVDINGITYVNTEEGGLTELEPYELPAPEPFKTFTLSGLVKWLKEDVDRLRERFDRLYVRVVDEKSVIVYSPAFGRHMQRDSLAVCGVAIPGIRFGEYMSQEDFSIHLQTRFEQVEDFDTVAQLSGNIRMEQEAKVGDDGISQVATMKDGISGLTDTIVKNPFILRPFRTFEEVEQPTSPFVLRIRKGRMEGAEVALFEADGGVWKNTAVKAIGAWLENELADLNVVVIA